MNMQNKDYPFAPVLLVDDELNLLQSLDIVLRTNGINNTITCQDSRNVLPTLMEHDVSVILLDLYMPYKSGQDLLLEINQKFPYVSIVIVTGMDEVGTAVNCMKAGAFDYIVKPVEKGRLIAVVKRGINYWELQCENRLLKQHVISGELEHPGAFSEIITFNTRMLSVFQYIESIATTSQPVLITGETGVGKELVARAVHTLSQRKGKFVSVNAGGLDDNVFSDTIFGHVKGAFTGAYEARKGLLEQASGGSLFLDEIGDIDNTSQVKLLRLLQEQEYFPVGSDMLKRSNARIIVATNKKFEELQESGKFRKDLFYRLRSHHIYIPPLRDRLDDLSYLVNRFLEESAKSMGKKKPTPPPELLALLSAYEFPGNVRELKSMIFDAVSNHKSRKLSMDVFKKWIFHDKLQKNSINTNSRNMTSTNGQDGTVLISYSSKLPTLKQAVQSAIEEAMKRSNGNQNIAAKQLGISRQALNKRLKSAKK